MNSIANGIYRLISKDDNSAVIVLSDESHPVFRAHFEGNPILPGFLHIDVTAEVFGLQITGVKSAKYFEIVRPNEQIVITMVKDGVYELSRDGVLLSKLEIKTVL